MKPFATVDDLTTLWRTLTDEEEGRAEALLPLISDALRVKAAEVGKDLDILAEYPAYNSMLKIVTVDVAARVLRQSTEGEPMTQESQSGLGYSWSGTYSIPGGGIGGAIMNNDLKRLGLLRQTIGAVKLWDGSKASQ